MHREDENGKRVFQASKYSGNKKSSVEDQIVVEGALQININGKPYTVTMRTPGSDFHLVRGLLFTEGIYTAAAPLKTKVIKTNDEGMPISINVWMPQENIGKAYYQSRSMLSVSSCGICGKKELADLLIDGQALQAKQKLKIDQIPDLFNKMKSHQHNFHSTGGSHAAACFDQNGNLLSIEEDIGRHNAVDKVVGALLQNNNRDSAFCLLVSGRVSFEIVSKCYKAGIPFLAAVSSPSSLSIETADIMGICLMAFCRGENITCYSHADRLIANKIQIITS